VSGKVSDHGDPDLSEHGVGSRTEEPLDIQVLFDALEEPRVPHSSRFGEGLSEHTAGLAARVWIDQFRTDGWRTASSVFSTGCPSDQLLQNRMFFSWF